MTSVVVIVADVTTYESNGVAPTKHDHVLKEFSATVPDSALRHRILPRTAISDAAGLNPHRPDSVHDGRIEDGVAVEDKILRRGVIGKSLPQLLSYPPRCWIECRVDVQNPSPAVLYHEEHIE